MLTRFDPSTDVSGFNQAKSSVVRGVRAKLLDLYPALADSMDKIIPKKEPVQLMKWYTIILHSMTLVASYVVHVLLSSHEHIEILTVKGELLFFKQRDGPYIPTLRLLHKCKDL